MSRLSDYIADVLREAQEEGYVTAENADLEVGQWIGGVSYQIAQKADQLLEPERYFKYNSVFYKVADLQKLEAHSYED